MLITMSALLCSPTLPAFPQDNPLGEFAGHSDVGSPKLPGSAGYDAARQEYTLTGAGSNMWVGRDEFQFVWKKMKGDFLLRTRAEFIGQGAVEHRKIGWMVRPSLEADAPYADCARHGVNLTSLQFRRSRGAITEQVVLPITNADVLQFERKGAAYIFSAAHYGEPFVSGQLTNLDLGDEVYLGLFICSHTKDVMEKAVFRDVRIIKPAAENFVPYRDYIGSVLEILDVPSGRLEVISSSPQPFEAPNWTRDGGALIYNLSGRAAGWGALCRFDLATRKASVLDTGPARQTITTMCCPSMARGLASVIKAPFTAASRRFSPCRREEGPRCRPPVCPLLMRMAGRPMENSSSILAAETANLIFTKCPPMAPAKKSG
jgi:hypothetical protein